MHDRSLIIIEVPLEPVWLCPRALEETTWVETLVRGKLRESDPVPQMLPMVLPENLLHYLFQTLELEIQPDDVELYWDHARARNCPWSHISDEHPGIIPCALYGDAAKYSTAGEKILRVFMSLVLWRPKSARNSIWLLFSVNCASCLGPQTLWPMYTKILDSMWKLYTHGLNINGKVMRFAISELKGDWEWHALSLNLTRTWRSAEFCWRCEASKTNVENHLCRF